MSTTLRSGLIRLAHANPELRPALLPLLADAGMPRKANSWRDVVDVPMGAGTKRGAEAWVTLIRHYILGNTEPESPERKALIDAAAKNLDYASFLYPKNRALGAYYTQQIRVLRDLMSSVDG